MSKRLKKRKEKNSLVEFSSSAALTWTLQQDLKYLKNIKCTFNQGWDLLKRDKRKEYNILKFKTFICMPLKSSTLVTRTPAGRWWQCTFNLFVSCKDSHYCCDVSRFDSLVPGSENTSEKVVFVSFKYSLILLQLHCDDAAGHSTQIKFLRILSFPRCTSL